MPMPAPIRKLALTAHVTLSVGWLGAVAGFLALNITGLASQDHETVRGSYLAMNLIGRFVIVPLSLAALATGLIQALGSEWGLFRHVWVLVKLLLSFVCAVVLLVKVPLMGEAAHLAAGPTLAGASLRMAGTQLLVHAAGGLLVLTGITALSVFKPWGRIRYGRRQQTERRDSSGSINLSPATPAVAGRSRRLGLFLAVVGAVLAGFVVLHLASGGFGHRGHH